MKKQKKYNCCVESKPCQDCISNELCKAWYSFVLQHKDPKSYAHFDKRVSLDLPSVRDYVLNTQKISKHSFYPFIHFTKRQSKYDGKESRVKPRELYYCCHLDRCVYQRYAFLLNQEYNAHLQQIGLNEVAIAYRDNLGKNNIDFAGEAFNAIKSQDECLIFVGDFTNFFDELDHIYLKKRLLELLNEKSLSSDYYAVFKNITRFSSWDWKLLIEHGGHNIFDRRLRKTINEKEIIISKSVFEANKSNIVKHTKGYGIPQGSPISAVLSNIYMLHFDKALNDYIKSFGGFYRRYSDDFIVILPCIGQEILNDLENTVTKIVNTVDRLILQKEKTKKYIYKDKKVFDLSGSKAEVDYLGFLFDGEKIKIRPKSITKYYYRMRRKAKTIASMRCFFSNKPISATKLYEIYSTGGKKQTFIDYAKRANSILHLTDSETHALIKHHKRKIAKAIKNK